MVERQDGWSDLEWQLRNWNYNTWLSGGQNTEQHIHSLDVATWVLGGYPLSARGMGGRQVHDSDLYGNAYDHMAVEYEYPDGVRLFSQCRQMDDCENLVATLVDGTQGRADTKGMIWGPDGKGTWRYRNRDAPNPYEQEHLDLIRSIREGEPLNETEAVAYSTLTGIMGRESAYSGEVIPWEEALSSKQDFTLKSYDFDQTLPVGPVPMPGTYQFV